MRRVVAMVLAITLLIVLPIGGLVGGGYFAYERTKPNEPVCGLFVLPQLLIIGFGLAVGFGIGLGIAWFATLGILRWANRAGLSDLPIDENYW